MIEAIIQVLADRSEGDPLKAALYASLFAAMMTTIGSSIILTIRNLRRVEEQSLLLDIGMAFSSGVMTVASFTSLLLPAIESAGFVKPFIGFILGALLIYLLNSVVPHEHIVKGYEGPRWGARKLLASWLVAIAIIIHNLPEGMAIGASSLYNIHEGLVLGIAIGLQDLPEGLAVALPIAIATGRKRLAILVGALSGFTEVIAALAIALLGSFTVSLLPVLLGLGAGAMMYVVSHEALPESHRTGHENKATLGFFLGFAVMLYLDTVVG